MKGSCTPRDLCNGEQPTQAPHSKSRHPGQGSLGNSNEPAWAYAANGKTGKRLKCSVLPCLHPNQAFDPDQSKDPRHPRSAGPHGHGLHQATTTGTVIVIITALSRLEERVNREGDAASDAEQQLEGKL